MGGGRGRRGGAGGRDIRVIDGLADKCRHTHPHMCIYTFMNGRNDTHIRLVVYTYTYIQEHTHKEGENKIVKGGCAGRIGRTRKTGDIEKTGFCAYL